MIILTTVRNAFLKPEQNLSPRANESLNEINGQNKEPVVRAAGIFTS